MFPLNLFRKSRSDKPAARRRTSRTLRLERLDSREMLSGVPWASTMSLKIYSPPSNLQISPPAYQGPQLSQGSPWQAGCLDKFGYPDGSSSSNFVIYGGNTYSAPHCPMDASPYWYGPNHKGAYCSDGMGSGILHPDIGTSLVLI